MPQLLIVHHTPSPSTQSMLEAVVDGASTDDLEGIDVVVRPALVAADVEVMEADGYVLGTPANIGYMSGAMKHFFDRIYYPCLEATQRRPYGLFVHGNSDTGGAVNAIASITKALEWRQVVEPVTVIGEVTGDDRDALWNLGATVAASLVVELD